ncbi:MULTISPECIES: winged helix-turn-helix domain-containing protein [unclassified Sphingomonas]|uniref:winged helix-turn-helix domain-containing protein n=1 Tax=unclassified Sphingomonas TaxID=196159 RepID=UPI0006F63609|nr:MULTISPECIES: LysR family transcriptional regulator [unclassified Sphingomonas]KQM23930.1 ModE family transcriptional regulator [Sphingomonas sp. Leaf9]KQM42059.1 ModE family transcriptional regulator [Sphingomonas sp. Leaf11]
MKLGSFWLKIQITCGDALAMGPGKADLLAAIIAEGSISGAGRALGMSYRRAWLLVDEMNRCFDPPLVETLKGGGRERGAKVSAAGLAVLEAYREMEREAAAIAERPAYARLRTYLRDAPVTND